MSPVCGFISIACILEGITGETGLPPLSTKSLTEYAMLFEGSLSSILTSGLSVFSTPIHLTSFLSIFIQLVSRPIPGYTLFEELYVT
jgi:hypothetical protein